MSENLSTNCQKIRFFCVYMNLITLHLKVNSNGYDLFPKKPHRKYRCVYAGCVYLNAGSKNAVESIHRTFVVEQNKPRQTLANH